MESLWFIKPSLSLTLAAALLMSGCPPTNISVTGKMAADNDEATFSMTHGGKADEAPQIIIRSRPVTGDLKSLSIRTTRQGTAPALGYELTTIVNEVTVGGSSFGGPGIAGDISFHQQNTGKMAKVSYYWYEDPEAPQMFQLPSSSFIRQTGNSWFARVRSGEKQALVPFSDTVSDRSIFLTPQCLGGTAPCFDMATLAGSIFAAFSTSFTEFADDDSNISLGGSDDDGDFALDYIPSVPVQMGSCSAQRTLPGFGFVFTGTLNGFFSSFEIKLPIIFAIGTEPDFINPQIKEFAVFVLPFEVIGSSCLESQGVGPIVVRATTPLGVGATQVAENVRNALLCNLVGSSLETIECPDETSEDPATPLMAIRGLGLIVKDTLDFYHRKAWGTGKSVSPAMNVYMRLRSADNKLTTTRMIPARNEDCPGALVITAGLPMCMVDLMVLE